jgi:hypothetical protein
MFIFYVVIKISTKGWEGWWEGERRGGGEGHQRAAVTAVKKKASLEVPSNRTLPAKS